MLSSIYFPKTGYLNDFLLLRFFALLNLLLALYMTGIFFATSAHRNALLAINMGSDPANLANTNHSPFRMVIILASMCFAIFTSFRLGRERHHLQARKN